MTKRNINVISITIAGFLLLISFFAPIVSIPVSVNETYQETVMKVEVYTEPLNKEVNKTSSKDLEFRQWDTPFIGEEFIKIYTYDFNNRVFESTTMGNNGRNYRISIEVTPIRNFNDPKPSMLAFIMPAIPLTSTLEENEIIKNALSYKYFRDPKYNELVYDLSDYQSYKILVGIRNLNQPIPVNSFQLLVNIRLKWDLPEIQSEIVTKNREVPTIVEKQRTVTKNKQVSIWQNMVGVK